MIKVKNMIELEKFAGIAMPQNYRDMSAYNGKEFECVCGKIHFFVETLNDRNYVARGANATMIVCCPNNYNSKTIITTTYKYFVIFQGLVSLAGYEEAGYMANNINREKHGVDNRINCNMAYMEIINSKKN